MKLEIGQELIRQTKAGVGDTCTVLRFDQIPRLDGSVLVTAVLSNGERVDPDGWYFDPANPSAWRAVEKPEPVKVRTIDEVFDAIVNLGTVIGYNEGGLAAGDPEVEALRAELKALVSCEECGEVNDRCTRHDDPPGSDQ